MAIFLGQQGCVELKRTQTDEEILGDVLQSDVNTVKNRFSFGFVPGMLITGDQIEIKTQDKTNLAFISASGWPNNKQYPDGVWYIFVDEVGAIMLYKTFDEAMSGEVSGRVQLENPGKTVPIEVRVRNNNYRVLAQVRNYELNTAREAVDVTSLSDEFKKQFSGIISGSGRISCFFEYERRECDPINDTSVGLLELPIYMNQLILRTQLGSEFDAKLFLISRGPKPFGTSRDNDDQIWYEFTARITNIAMQFDPTEAIESTIDFVTTGQIKLRTKFVSNYLTQQDLGLLRLEDNQDSNSFLEVEQQE